MQHIETEDPNKPPNHTNRQMEADSGRDFAAEKPESYSSEKHEKKKKRKQREIQLANGADDPTATDVVVEALSSSKSDDKKSRKWKKENDVLAGGTNSTAKISEEGLDIKPGPKKKRNTENDGAVGGSGNGTAEIGGSNKEGDSDVTATSKPRAKKKLNKGKDVAAVGSKKEMSNASKIGASGNPQNANPRMKKPSKPRKRVSFAGEVEVFDDKRENFRRKEDDDPLVQGKRFTPEEDAMIKEAVRKCIELRDNISWDAISTKLSTRVHSACCTKWYRQLSSPFVSQGLRLDMDDYRLLDALQNLDACCIDDVDWDNLIKYRPGDMPETMGADGPAHWRAQGEVLH